MNISRRVQLSVSFIYPDPIKLELEDGLEMAKYFEICLRQRKTKFNYSTQSSL